MVTFEVRGTPPSQPPSQGASPFRCGIAKPRPVPLRAGTDSRRREWVLTRAFSFGHGEVLFVSKLNLPKRTGLNKITCVPAPGPASRLIQAVAGWEAEERDGTGTTPCPMQIPPNPGHSPESSQPVVLLSSISFYFVGDLASS